MSSAQESSANLMSTAAEDEEKDLFPLTSPPRNGHSTDANYNKTRDDLYHEKLQNDRSEALTQLQPISKNSEEADEDIRCGYGKWKPDCLQICNNPKCLLFFLSIFAMTQGFVINGVNNVNTSTIERRFQLSSSSVGSISSAYDVSAAIIGLFISYYGYRKHKARMVALAAVTMSVGSFVMALPHFTTGVYEAGQSIIKICREDYNTTDVDSCTKETDSYLQSYLYVFLFGQILHGFGGTTLHIVGISLIDDSVTASSSPMYVGILYAIFTLGPAFGYILGGKLLDIYVDFNVVSTDSIDITPEDPRWAGAWWIGFVIGMGLFLSISIPIFGFGKELPDAEYVRKTRVSQVHKNKADDRLSSSEFTGSIKELPRTFLTLIQNPPFMFVTLAGAAEGLSISGFSTFMPKFIQNQFGLTAAKASILGGLMVVPGAAGGQFIGGVVCKRWKLKVKGILRFIVIVCVSGLLVDNFVWIKCEQNQIAGVNTNYFNESKYLPNLEAECNSNCSCTKEFYEPVCGQDGIQYFSACHAGCSGSSIDHERFENCSCVHPIQSINTTYVTSGKCEGGCKILYLFLPMLLLAVFFRFVQAAPALSVTLRVIPESQKTFALGIQWFLVRMLGTVPGPILFGSVIDNACIVWQDNCEDEASCWIYDNALLSRNFFLIIVIVKACVCVLFILAYKFYKPPADVNDIHKDPSNVTDETK